MPPGDDNAATVNLDQAGVGRLSRMDAMQQQAMALASVQRLAIQQRRVEAALARVRSVANRWASTPSRWWRSSSTEPAHRPQPISSERRS